jgi:hypothetical protein
MTRALLDRGDRGGNLRHVGQRQSPSQSDHTESRRAAEEVDCGLFHPLSDHRHPRGNEAPIGSLPVEPSRPGVYGGRQLAIRQVVGRVPSRRPGRTSPVAFQSEKSSIRCERSICTEVAAGIVSIAVIVAVGVNSDGRREFLGMDIVRSRDVLDGVFAQARPAGACAASSSSSPTRTRASRPPWPRCSTPVGSVAACT